MKVTTRADLFGSDDKERVHYDKIDKVAVLTISDDNMNGYTYKMFRRLDERILQARFDSEVQVVVIIGDGEHFCAGANINMLEEADPTSKYYFCLHANETLSRLEQTPKLVIAAINGHCVGGGFEIALACDLRIARNLGGRIGLPEVNLGVLPGTGGTQRLTRLVGGARALKLMIDGTTMNTNDAAATGLIHAVVGETVVREIRGREREVSDMSRDEFLACILEIANGYCTPKKASMAVGHIKRAVQSGGELPLESGLTIERELQAKLFASHDASEGLSAFVEKRGVEFEGK